MDNSKHGGSIYKLFKERAGNKAELLGDLDELGNFIENKHSSGAGKIFEFVARR